MKFNEFDAVVLLRDYQKEGLKKGDIGAVVMVHTEPNEAYEVEFVNEKGITKAIITLLPNEIDKA
ncbi:DUF4926 domain-containing protein [Acetivibrio straminisolvens]|jgi:hypothetical protein|uniref:DUF4926 domain-containing protein n=1 Tax=Acetivibrio straminisolvens JCM 21531 TaxID=1294263 RepID=W4VCT8_9FIRM|nr:DUF4926 domain-containing protein [Acetivibrio straminisolvens]GAE90986.1 hypothetical protein JCM21531_4654 [Acetivibrio straminisolvens JCM 21531]HHU83540.1 DUF4926 domain-containing protein [Bacillota bacterium]